MAILLGQVYDKTIEDMVFAYDLDRVEYFGRRYIVSYGCCLATLHGDAALMKLFEFKGDIQGYPNKKDAMKALRKVR